MLGNVAEWCDSKYVAYPGSPVASPNFTKGHYVVRGGGYRSPQEEANGAARSFLPPGTGQKDVGFRCAVMVP
jgi:formylglycine-generating enzyme required for sulfatase activity